MHIVNLLSTLTCPHCGHNITETMPTDACQWFYECEQCKEMLRPQPGDCCVFRSYGSVPCPPKQAGGGAGCCGNRSAPPNQPDPTLLPTASR